MFISTVNKFLGKLDGRKIFIKKKTKNKMVNKWG